MYKVKRNSGFRCDMQYAFLLIALNVLPVPFAFSSATFDTIPYQR